MALETLTLEELPGGRTRLTAQSVFQSVADRDGAQTELHARWCTRLRRASGLLRILRVAYQIGGLGRTVYRPTRFVDDVVDSAHTTQGNDDQIVELDS